VLETVFAKVRALFVIINIDIQKLVLIKYDRTSLSRCTTSVAVAEKLHFAFYHNGNLPLW